MKKKLIITKKFLLIKKHDNVLLQFTRARLITIYDNVLLQFTIAWLLQHDTERTQNSAGL